MLSSMNHELAIVLLLFFAAAICSVGAPVDLAKTKVVVCVGDSITDGETYALMTAQALKEANKPVPLFIPAGIGGDTSSGILKRLERDVLPFKPQLVMLNCGINDTSLGVKTKDFEANLCAIVERLRMENVQTMILTLTTIRPVPRYNEEDLKCLEQEFLSFEAANLILRRVAEKYDCPMAECARVMGAAPPNSNLWEDSAHLNFAGYRLMSRAIIDAFGCPDAELPATFEQYKPPVMPGIIRRWRIRPAVAGEQKLDEKAVTELIIDKAWQTYKLPEKDSVLPTAGWWSDQERQRGFAMQLQEKFGPAPRYYGYAEIKSPKKRTAYVNTGGSLGQVYVNGIRVYNSEYTTGWHAGGHRIPITLEKGKNKLIIVTGDRFFCSVTDTMLW